MLVHPDELIATFFIPLPEPLGTPQGSAIPTYTRAVHELTQEVRDTGLRFNLVPTRSGTGRALDMANLFERDADGRTNYINKFFLSSSVMVYHVADHPFTHAGFGASQVVAGLAFENEVPPAEELALTTQPLFEGHLDGLWDAAERSSMGQVTVLEVAVGLRVIADVPALPESILLGPPTREEDWDYKYVVRADDRSIDLETLQERLACALDRALCDIRGIQQAYALAVEEPITLINRARLPLMVPTVIRALRDINAKENVESTMVMPGFGARSFFRPDDLDDERMRIFRVARDRLQDGTFAAFAHLRRDANAMWRLQGELRVAGLLYGLAAESLLDELLLHLMWEEGMTPEKSADSWIDGLDTRVKKLYSNRLGGNWRLSGGGAVGNWNRRTAELRHRIAHGTYEPSWAEIADSDAAVNELTKFLCDRLCAPTVIRTYPRAALSLAGRDGVKQRGRYSERLRRLQDSLDEPHWDSTVARWRAAHRRIRGERLGKARTPDVAGSMLVAVLQVGEPIQWCLHDRQAALAAEVMVTESTLDEYIKTAVASTLDQLRNEGVENAVSLAVLHREGVHIASVGKWREEYHLIPLAEVMVNRSDRSV